MAKKDLACGSWRPGFGIPVRLADFKISFDVNTATAQKIAEVIVGSVVEREDTVPCDTRIGTCCRSGSVPRMAHEKLRTYCRQDPEEEGDSW